MMQEYDFSGEETYQTAGTVVRPPEQVLRKILDFARCYQSVEVECGQVRFFLN